MSELKWLLERLQDGGWFPTLDESLDVLFLAQQLSAANRMSDDPDSDAQFKLKNSGQGISVHEPQAVPGKLEEIAVSPSGSIPGGQIQQMRVGMPQLVRRSKRLGLERALWPLRRRTPLQANSLLDEVATSERTADLWHYDLRVWQPEFSKARTRWYDVVLLIDTALSMTIWAQEVHEFSDLLEKQKFVRHFTRYFINTDSPGKIKLSISSKTMGANNEKVVFNDNLIKHGQTLFLVISDCMGVGWSNGQMIKFLKPKMSTAQVVLVQPLPQRLWYLGAALHNAGRGYVAPHERCEPNDHMSVFPPEYKKLYSKHLPLPVIFLRERSIVSWAKSASGLEGQVLPVIYFSEQNTFKQEGLSPEQRLRIFNNRASDETLQFARLMTIVFSKISFNLQNARAMAQVLGPGWGNEVLAEFLFSRLIKVDISEKAEVMFSFQPGVAEPLSTGLTFNDIHRTLVLLSNEQGELKSAIQEALLGVAPDGKPGTETPQVSLPEWRLGSASKPKPDKPLPLHERIFLRFGTRSQELSNLVRNVIAPPDQPKIEPALSPTEQFRKAENLWRNGEWKQAKRELEKFMDLAGDKPDYASDRTWTKQHLEDLDTLQRYCERAEAYLTTRSSAVLIDTIIASLESDKASGNRYCRQLLRQVRAEFRRVSASYGIIKNIFETHWQEQKYDDAIEALYDLYADANSPELERNQANDLAYYLESRLIRSTRYAQESFTNGNLDEARKFLNNIPHPVRPEQISWWESYGPLQQLLKQLLENEPDTQTTPPQASQEKTDGIREEPPPDPKAEKFHSLLRQLEESDLKLPDECAILLELIEMGVKKDNDDQPLALRLEVAQADHEQRFGDAHKAYDLYLNAQAELQGFRPKARVAALLERAQAGLWRVWEQVLPGRLQAIREQIDRGELEAARQACKALLDVRANPDVQALLVEIETIERNRQEARKSARVLLEEIERALADGNLGRAEQLLAQIGDLPEAKKPAQEVRQRHQEFEKLVQAAQAKAQQLAFAEAVNLYDQALELDRANWAVLTAQGQANTDKNRLARLDDMLAEANSFLANREQKNLSARYQEIVAYDQNSNWRKSQIAQLQTAVKKLEDDFKIYQQTFREAVDIGEIHWPDEVEKFAIEAYKGEGDQDKIAQYVDIDVGRFLGKHHTFLADEQNTIDRRGLNELADSLTRLREIQQHWQPFLDDSERLAKHTTSGSLAATAELAAMLGAYLPVYEDAETRLAQIDAALGEIENARKEGKGHLAALQKADACLEQRPDESDPVYNIINEHYSELQMQRDQLRRIHELSNFDALADAGTNAKSGDINATTVQLKEIEWALAAGNLSRAGQLLEQVGDLPEAKKLAQKVRLKRQEFEKLMQAAQAKAQQLAFADAVDLYDRALELDRANWAVLTVQGQANADKNRLTRLDQMLAEAEELLKSRMLKRLSALFQEIMLESHNRNWRLPEITQLRRELAKLEQDYYQYLDTFHEAVEQGEIHWPDEVEQWAIDAYKGDGDQDRIRQGVDREVGRFLEKHYIFLVEEENKIERRWLNELADSLAHLREIRQHWQPFLDNPDRLAKHTTSHSLAAISALAAMLVAYLPVYEEAETRLAQIDDALAGVKIALTNNEDHLAALHKANACLEQRPDETNPVYDLIDEKYTELQTQYDQLKRIYEAGSVNALADVEMYLKLGSFAQARKTLNSLLADELPAEARQRWKELNQDTIVCETLQETFDQAEKDWHVGEWDKARAGFGRVAAIFKTLRLELQWGGYAPAGFQTRARRRMEVLVDDNQNSEVIKLAGQLEELAKKPLDKHNLKQLQKLKMLPHFAWVSNGDNQYLYHLYTGLSRREMRRENLLLLLRDDLQESAQELFASVKEDDLDRAELFRFLQRYKNLEPGLQKVDRLLAEAYRQEDISEILRRLEKASEHLVDVDELALTNSVGERAKNKKRLVNGMLKTMQNIEKKLNRVNFYVSHQRYKEAREELAKVLGNTPHDFKVFRDVRQKEHIRLNNLAHVRQPYLDAIQNAGTLTGTKTLTLANLDKAKDYLGQARDYLEQVTGKPGDVTEAKDDAGLVAGGLDDLLLQQAEQAWLAALEGQAKSAWDGEDYPDLEALLKLGEGRESETLADYRRLNERHTTLAVLEAHVKASELKEAQDACGRLTGLTDQTDPSEASETETWERRVAALRLVQEGMVFLTQAGVTVDQLNDHISRLEAALPDVWPDNSIAVDLRQKLLKRSQEQN